MSVVSVYMLAYWAWAHYSIKLALHSYCLYYKKDTSIKILTFTFFFLTQNNIQTKLHKIIAHFYRLNFFFFFISNKDSLISKRERHPSTQGVYRGEQIKNEHYKRQVNPK